MVTKVLVLGGTGMLGSAVVQYLQGLPGLDIWSTYRSSSEAIAEKVAPRNVDWMPFDAREDDITELPLDEADYTINCIGIIKPYVMDRPLSTIHVNVEFPHLLAATSTRLIHITTDCVFSGNLLYPETYTEDSVHDALDVYGKSKSLGEPEDAMVLRTSIIGQEIHKFASLISWAQSQKGKKVNGFTNHYWNGITTRQYAEVCFKIIQEQLFEPGVFHVHSPDFVNKYQLLTLLDAKFDLHMDIRPVEAPSAVNRLLSSKKGLCAKLELPSIEEQIRRL